MGPMYSGKTERMIEQINEISVTHKCLVVKYRLDDRYGKSDELVSKSGRKIKTSHNVRLISTDVLPFVMKDETHIFIDEGQFYSDIFEYCTFWLSENKKIFITCLNGDYMRRVFSESMVKLIPHCDKIHHLLSTCYYCGNDAPFTYKSVDGDELIVIGGDEIYKALCRTCYSEQMKRNC